MKLLIISDIHGNVSALNEVLKDSFNRFNPDAIAILGDIIDYGMRSNEVIEILKEIKIPIICSLWGNHEYAIMKDDYSRFSSERGVISAKRTKRILTNESIEYLNELDGKTGILELGLEGKRILAVHGSIDDVFWGKILPNCDNDKYKEYDYVFSGHTHFSHIFSVFYKSDNSEYRNMKKTVFINPGSVGQPRNHNPKAQYAILDFEVGIFLCGVDYDIVLEQSLFNSEVDPFYRERLKKRI